MAHDNLLTKQMSFLSQDPATLRSVRGRELRETLDHMDLGYNAFFKAAGTSIEQYCAEEFGVDLRRITVDKFFQSDPNSKWLFPDIVRDAVLVGMRRKPVYPQLIIRDESIEGTSYDVPYVVEDAGKEELRSVAEGASIPESEITYGDRVVKIDKKGRGVIASYEVIRRMSIDMLRVHLQRMGERLGRNLDARIATVLVSGDSSGAATAAPTVDTATADTWTYADVIKGFLNLTVDNYFTATHMLANKDLAQTLLGLSEFKDPVLFDFARTGNYPTPLGVKLIPMADQPADKLTILDAGYAVEKLTEQDLIVESDKLINQQWDRSYLTIVTDFAVIYENARVVVQSDWT
jgi:hypothetical protein